MKPSDFQKLVSAAIFERSSSRIADMNCQGAGILNVQEAVEVYSAGYPARLFEALGETYETIWKVLGDEDFQNLCISYIQDNPSRFRNLSDYGENFSKFIEGYLPEDTSRDLLSDLAKFEWAFKECFHERFEKSAAINDLAKTDPENIHFQLLDNIETLFVRFRVHRLHGVEGNPEMFEGVLKSPLQQYLILIRSENGVITREISPILGEFLSIPKSRSFDLNFVAAFCGSQADKVQQLIGEIAKNGLIKAVTT